MRELKHILLEKLHLRKGMQVEIDDIRKNYDVGDTCLLLVHYNNYHGLTYVMLDAVKIESITGESYKLKFLTRTSETNKSIVSRRFVAETIYKNDKYLQHDRTNNITCYLIPRSDGIEILDFVVKNRKQISCYSILHKEKGFSPGEHVYENNKNSSIGLSFITDDSLKQIIDKLQ